MSLNPHSTSMMAAERFRDFERTARHGDLAGEIRGDHASLLARMRDRLPFVPPRERRTVRPARA